jgi:hypothetical protein
MNNADIEKIDGKRDSKREDKSGQKIYPNDLLMCKNGFQQENKRDEKAQQEAQDDSLQKEADFFSGEKHRQKKIATSLRSILSDHLNDMGYDDKLTIFKKQSGTASLEKSSTD